MVLAKTGFLIELARLFLITQLKSFFSIKFSNLGFMHLSSSIMCSKRLTFGRWFYLGRNTKIELMFSKGYSIGKRFTLKDNSVISSRGNWNIKSGYLTIGNNVGFSESSLIYVRGNISIGDDCIFGPGVRIFSDTHTKGEEGLWRLGRPHNCDVVIGKNVWCGSNVVIMPGVKIGDNSVIGAGSVITKNIPSDEVWVGVPAKRLK